MASTDTPATLSDDKGVVADAPLPSSSTPLPTAPPPSIEPDFGVFKVWNPPKSASTSASGKGHVCLLIDCLPDLHTSAVALPDEYFEPTSEELKAAWKDQSRLVDRLTNAPLKTQAIREREEKAKANRWPEVRTRPSPAIATQQPPSDSRLLHQQTNIRIKFPNQLMLEHKFDSSSTIKVVYAYVRNALTDEAKQNKFVLCKWILCFTSLFIPSVLSSQTLIDEATPRRELRVSDPEVKTKTLSQLGLAPSSILHFGFLDESLNS